MFNTTKKRVFANLKNKRRFSTGPEPSVSDVSDAITAGDIIRAESLIEAIWVSQMSSQLLLNAIAIADFIGPVKQQEKILMAISTYLSASGEAMTPADSAALADLGSYLQSRASVLSAMGCHGMALLRLDIAVKIAHALRDPKLIADTHERQNYLRAISSTNEDKLVTWKSLSEPSPANRAFAESLATTDLVLLIQLSSMHFSVGLCTLFMESPEILC